MTTPYIPGISTAAIREGTVHENTGVKDSLGKIKYKEDQQKAPLNSETLIDPTRYGDWERNGRCIDF